MLQVWREGKGQRNAGGPGAVMTELSLSMFCSFNRPYSYSPYRTGTSLQVKLMQGSLFKCKLH